MKGNNDLILNEATLIEAMQAQEVLPLSYERFNYGNLLLLWKRNVQ